MSEKSKIRIQDDLKLRMALCKRVAEATQVELAIWAVGCAEHILILPSDENFDREVIEEGFCVNVLWREQKASVHDVRQAGFRIHKAARSCISELSKNQLRTAGQAVAVGHMREHALVCSDYAIKVIGMFYSNDPDKVTAERTWQLKTLERIVGIGLNVREDLTKL